MLKQIQQLQQDATELYAQGDYLQCIQKCLALLDYHFDPSALTLLRTVLTSLGYQKLLHLLDTYQELFLPGSAMTVPMASMVEPPAKLTALFHQRFTPASPRPLVSASLIVRNEAERLQACLESIEPLVDEIVVVDTGSTDQTVSIARDFSAKVRLYFHPWEDNFGATRNLSLGYCQGDWILSIDGDEVLLPTAQAFLARLFQFKPPGLTLFGVPIEHLSDTPGGSQIAAMIRVFPRHSLVRFHGRIHEGVFVMDPQHSFYQCNLPQVMIRNHGCLTPEITRHQKSRRHLLLEKSLNEPEYNHPFIRYHYACSFLYREQRDEGKALTLLQQAVADSLSVPPGMPHTYRLAPISWACQEIFELLTLQAKWSSIIDLYPHYAPHLKHAGAYFWYAHALIQMGQSALAEQVLLQCFDPTLKPWRFQQGYDTWQPLALLLEQAIQRRDLAATTVLTYRLMAWYPTGEMPGYGSLTAVLKHLWDSLQWNEAVCLYQLQRSCEDALKAAQWHEVIRLACLVLWTRPDPLILKALLYALAQMGHKDLAQHVQHYAQQLYPEQVFSLTEGFAPAVADPWLYPLQGLFYPGLEKPRLTVVIVALAEEDAQQSRNSVQGIADQVVVVEPTALTQPLGTLSLWPDPGNWLLWLYAGEILATSLELSQWCRWRANGRNVFALRIASPAHNATEVRLFPAHLQELPLLDAHQPREWWAPNIHTHQLPHIWIAGKSP